MTAMALAASLVLLFLSLLVHRFAPARLLAFAILVFGLFPLAGAAGVTLIGATVTLEERASAEQAPNHRKPRGALES
jgi:hypothetical protein